MGLIRKTGREDWIEAGLQLLASGGWTSLGVAAVAAELRVSRLCFYDHFQDRQDWLSALLAFWEYRVFAGITLNGQPGQDRIDLLDVTRAVIEWAAHHQPAADALARLRQEEATLLRHALRQVA